MSRGMVQERWMWDEKGLALPRRSIVLDVFALLWTVADEDGLVQPVLIGSISFYLDLEFRQAEIALANLVDRGLVTIKQHRKNECLYLIQIETAMVDGAVSRVKAPSLEDDLLLGRPVMVS